MKKYIYISLLAIAALSFASCSEKDPSSPKDDPASTYDATKDNKIKKDVVTINGETVDFETGKLSELVGSSTVTSLAFGRCTLSINDVKAIKDMKSLATLDLSPVVFTDGESYTYDPYTKNPVTKSTTLPEYMIASLPELVEVKVPGGITTVGACNFYNCVKLEKIEFGNFITTFERYCLRYIAVKELVLPDSVVSLNEPFSSCDQLEKLTLGKSLECFAPTGINSLKELVIRSKKMGQTDRNALRTCPNIEKFTFEGDCDNLEVLEGNILISKDRGYLLYVPQTIIYGDYTLPVAKNYSRDLLWYVKATNLVVPEGVESLGFRAFMYANVTNLDLPSTINYVGSYCFGANCTIAQMTVRNPEPPRIASDAFTNSKITKIIVPKDALAKYRSTAVWSTQTFEASTTF